MNTNTQTSSPPPAPAIKHVLAVMSGKGGVGKSTTAALLAAGLRRTGWQVGLLDADVTGASIPKLFGMRQPPLADAQGILLPAMTHSGIKLISVNLMLEHEDDAVIWRGPLISKMIQQFWNDVAWGQLDALVVDLPPGTSDAALTVLQSLPVTGVIIVTTPQDLADMIVRKAANMTRQINKPILGVVENMSYAVCPTATRAMISLAQVTQPRSLTNMACPFWEHWGWSRAWPKPAMRDRSRRTRAPNLTPSWKQ